MAVKTNRRRRKRCKICGKLFTPNPRTTRIQYVCSEDECQEERRKLSVKGFREKHSTQLQEARLLKKLYGPISKKKPSISDILEKANWNALLESIEPELKVVLEEMLKMISSLDRDVEKLRRSISHKL